MYKGNSLRLLDY